MVVVLKECRNLFGGCSSRYYLFYGCGCGEMMVIWWLLMWCLFYDSCSYEYMLIDGFIAGENGGCLMVDVLVGRWLWRQASCLVVVAVVR